MNDVWRVLSVVFAVCLAISVGFNLHQYIHGSNNSSGNNSSIGSFSFVWGPESQKIINGTLWLNMTFEADAEGLSIVAKVNDYEYHRWDSLQLVFDTNENGVIELSDPAYVLLESNETYDIGVFFVNVGYYLPTPQMLPHPSPYHICVFKENEGYTFIAHFSGLKTHLVYVVFHSYEEPPKSLKGQEYVFVPPFVFGG